MILINIDSLSTTELQNIAHQEGFERWQTLDRTQLIAALEDAYEDQDDEQLPVDAKASAIRKRFCNSLTDFRGDLLGITGLPGVEELPKQYAETAIHLLLRDMQWAYAYWSLSPMTRSELTDEDGHLQGTLFLRVSLTDPTSKKVGSSFDIEIGLDDDEWNINLPEIGPAYRVFLCFRNRKGREEKLAQSSFVETCIPYWADHFEEMAMDEKLFSMHFSSVVTKEGEVAENAVLRQIAATLGKGVLQ